MCHLQQSPGPSEYWNPDDLGQRSKTVETGGSTHSRHCVFGNHGTCCLLGNFCLESLLWILIVRGVSKFNWCLPTTKWSFCWKVLVWWSSSIWVSSFHIITNQKTHCWWEKSRTSLKPVINTDINFIKFLICIQIIQSIYTWMPNPHRWASNTMKHWDPFLLNNPPMFLLKCHSYP